MEMEKKGVAISTKTKEELLSSQLKAITPIEAGKIAKALTQSIRNAQYRAKAQKRKVHGYVETHIHTPIDSVGQAKALTEAEEIEAKIEDMDFALSSLSAETLAKAEEIGTQRMRLRVEKRAIYDAKVLEAKRIALKTINALMRFPSPNGTLAPLTPFERELKRELQTAQEMGIYIPFLFNHKTFAKTDPVILWIKAIEAELRKEDAEENLRTLTSAMDKATLSRHAKAAALFIAKLKPLTEGKEK